MKLETLEGSFLAVPKPIFANKYSFELRSNLKRDLKTLAGICTTRIFTQISDFKFATKNCQLFAAIPNYFA